MKNGTKTLVKDPLYSLQRDLATVNIEPEAYLKEFGPKFGSREAECEAVVSEKMEPQPWVTEVFTTKEAARKEAAKQGPPTMRSYSLEFGDDLRSPKKRHEVLQDIKTKQPKLLLMAFPCGPWSNLTYSQKDQAKSKSGRIETGPF
eukprot:9389002-Pyramimonas_sp.AAC.1